MRVCGECQRGRGEVKGPAGLLPAPCQLCGKVDCLVAIDMAGVGLGVEGLVLIPAGPEHRPYVCSTWIHLVVEMTRGRGWPRRATGEAASRMADAMYERVRVVIRPEAPETVHAWICAEPGALYAMHVPHVLRDTPMTRAMLRATVGSEEP